jgi:hypothetical protein
MRENARENEESLSLKINRCGSKKEWHGEGKFHELRKERFEICI